MRLQVQNTKKYFYYKMENVLGCLREPFAGNRRFALDHEHQSGEKHRTGQERRPFVRGILCWNCNRSLRNVER